MVAGRPAFLAARPSTGRTPVPIGLPPHDIGAEEATLAALLLDDECIAAVAAIVEEGDFFREQNAWIYEACLSLWRRGELATIPTVAHELDRAGRLDDAGGEPYLATLAGRYFTSIGVEAHARIVARDAAYRDLISVAGQMAQIAYAGGPDFAVVIDRCLELLRSVRCSEPRLPIEGTRSVFP